MIVVQCGQCGQRLSAQDEWAGRRTKCPKCGREIAIPAADIIELPPPPPVELGNLVLPMRPPGAGGFGPPASAGGAALAAGPASKGSKTMIWVVAGLGVFGLVVLMGFVIFVFANMGGEPEVTELAPMPNTLRGAAVEWTLDPALALKLGPEVTFDRYAVRLPPDFTALEVPVPESAEQIVQIYAWGGPPQPDGSRNSLEATVLMSRSGIPMDGSFGPARNIFLEGLAGTGAEDINVQSEQYGRIGGREFLRMTFIATRQGAAHNGVAYFTSDAGQIVTLHGSTLSPFESEDFQLLLAAPLTLRDKPVETTPGFSVPRP